MLWTAHTVWPTIPRLLFHCFSLFKMNYSVRSRDVLQEHRLCNMLNCEDLSDDVYEDMAATLAIKPITKERLRKIPRTNTYANSVNAYVGRPRSGKTYLALHDIISVIRNDSNVHLLVYINEKGDCDDDTFDRFQELIDVPVIFVKYSDCEKFLKTLLDYKQIYNKIKNNNVPAKEIPEKVSTELFESLHIDDFSRDHLHTLIMLEDATNSKALRKADSYINDLLTRCAHTQFSFFIIIHYWKALTPNIKANLSTIYIFGGYSRQQMQYMLSQMNIPISFKELYPVYANMGAYGKLVVDANTCQFNILK